MLGLCALHEDKQAFHTMLVCLYTCAISSLGYSVVKGLAALPMQFGIPTLTGLIKHAENLVVFTQCLETCITKQHKYYTGIHRTS